jgi:hypothetical protein
MAFWETALHGTSLTRTWMPVSSSHPRPVMLLPSIAIRPASSAVLIVVPAY